MVYRQGDLDGLCGVYSVVNSTALVLGRRLSRDRKFRLFSELCDILDKKVGLSHAMVYGTSAKNLKRLLDHVASVAKHETGIALAYRRASRSPETISGFWEKLLSHRQQYGPGSIILRMSDPVAHWTCIHDIDGTAIRLADSYRFRRFPKDECAIESPTFEGGFGFVPRKTFLIWRAGSDQVASHF